METHLQITNGESESLSFYLTGSCGKTRHIRHMGHHGKTGRKRAETVWKETVWKLCAWLSNGMIERLDRIFGLNWWKGSPMACQEALKRLRSP